MIKEIFKFLAFILLGIIIGCKNPNNKIVSNNKTHINSIKYAKGFRIENYPDFKKLTINTSFQGDDNSSSYYLIPKSKVIPDSLTDKRIIRIPVERIVVTSTTHIPMLELLGKEKTLVGFPNTKYISSKKTRQLIDNNKIKELGQEQNINTELLIDLQPELVVGFGVANTSKIFDHIQKMGIPVIFNSDWLEETPLGRAEWLRFFGALYDEDSLALEKFDEISKRYNSLKSIVKNAKDKPTILSGALFQDTWHLPAGNSYVSHFIADAGGNYLWKETKGTGSLSLSFESVLERGAKADYWIAPGYYSSKKVMQNDSPHYKEFLSFTKGNIYTFSNTKGETGGVLYYELATTRPDLVLQDLIKIFHQDVLPDYQMTFFSKLE